ncbi:MAG: hypothetical protein ACLRSW_05525 [Christensenellaceae bacterium]
MDLKFHRLPSGRLVVLADRQRHKRLYAVAGSMVGVYPERTIPKRREGSTNCRRLRRGGILHLLRASGSGSEHAVGMQSGHDLKDWRP